MFYLYLPGCLRGCYDGPASRACVFVRAARNTASMNAKLVAAGMTVINLACANAAGDRDCAEWTCVLIDPPCSFLVVRRVLLCSCRAWCVVLSSRHAVMLHCMRRCRKFDWLQLLCISLLGNCFPCLSQNLSTANSFTQRLQPCNGGCRCSLAENFLRNFCVTSVTYLSSIFSRRPLDKEGRKL